MTVSTPTPRALRMLRAQCAVATSETVGHTRWTCTHVGPDGDTCLTLETGKPWPTIDPAELERVGLSILWRMVRRGMPRAQAIRLVALAETLRAEHGDAVTTRGATVRVDAFGGADSPRSRIAATVERDGGAWLTWADGSRTYDPPSTCATCGGEPDRCPCDGKDA